MLEERLDLIRRTVGELEQTGADAIQRVDDLRLQRPSLFRSGVDEAHRKISGLVDVEDFHLAVA